MENVNFNMPIPKMSREHVAIALLIAVCIYSAGWYFASREEYKRLEYIDNIKYNQINELSNQLEAQRNLTIRAIQNQNVSLLYGQAIMADYLCNPPRNLTREEITRICTDARSIRVAIEGNSTLVK
jgi:divalent metal cation (Fe/Co/Zn/Cd) transporter